MSDHLVVLESFSSEIDAQIMRNRLEAEGIQSTLEGSASTNVFALGNSFSTVKIMIHESDLDRAIDILNSEEDVDRTESEIPEEWFEHDSESTEKIEAAPDEDDEDDEDEIDPTDPMYLARRAERTAIFSYLIFPLSLYCFWLVIKALTREKSVSPQAGKLLLWALLLVSFSLLFTAGWISLLFFD